jgi:hypothetical protein
LFLFTVRRLPEEVVVKVADWPHRKKTKIKVATSSSSSLKLIRRRRKRNKEVVTSHSSADYL